MSGIVGLSDKEITAIADAYSTLCSLAHVTNGKQHRETADVLNGLLRRIHTRFGSAADRRPGEFLLTAIHAVLPPEEDDKEA